MTIDRRLFLKASGAVAMVGVLGGVRAARAPLAMRAPGAYQISGRVRLEAPTVTITGISNAQQISWTPGSLSTPVASFTSFERFDAPWAEHTVHVTGGRLEALQVVPLDFL